MSKRIGDEAEQQARAYLQAQGLRLITTNYRCRWGEIDLVMGDRSTIVFVEVRARKSLAFGGAIASITKTKQIKLIQTAKHYQVVHKLKDNYSLRFDIVLLQGMPRQIEWIQNAFGVN